MLVVNDVQVVVWVEYYVFFDDICDMVFIIVLIGVGGGVVCDGKFFIGKGGLVGYLGYILVDLYGFVCGCGCVGCVEVIVFG